MDDHSLTNLLNYDVNSSNYQFIETQRKISELYRRGPSIRPGQIENAYDDILESAREMMRRRIREEAIARSDLAPSLRQQVNDSTERNSTTIVELIRPQRKCLDCIAITISPEEFYQISTCQRCNQSQRKGDTLITACSHTVCIPCWIEWKVLPQSHSRVSDNILCPRCTTACPSMGYYVVDRNRHRRVREQTIMHHGNDFSAQ